MLYSTFWIPLLLAGLEESDKHGIPLVRHVIPCPTCAVHGPLFRMRRSLSMRNVQELEESRPPEFSLMECAAAAVDHTEIACPQHVDNPVKLSSLVPDLVLSDLPPDLVIDNKVSQREFILYEGRFILHLYRIEAWRISLYPEWN